MKFLSKITLISCLLLTLFIQSTHQDCVNLCYSRSQGGGFCDICYYQCSNTAQAFFTSCRYQSKQSSQSKELTQSQCYQYCYPQMLKEVVALEKVTEKLNNQQKPNKITSLHEVSSSDLQKQLQKEERDVDMIIFAMAGCCAIFTIIAIIMIIRCFEHKDQSKRTIDTKYTENEEKQEMPDIQVDSASSYYQSKQDIPQKLNL